MTQSFAPKRSSDRTFHIYMYVCMYACMGACMRVCIYVYIYFKFLTEQNSDFASQGILDLKKNH